MAILGSIAGNVASAIVGVLTDWEQPNQGGGGPAPAGAINIVGAEENDCRLAGTGTRSEAARGSGRAGDASA